MSGAPLSRSVLITNKRGLHARASARFVTLASGLPAHITVSKDGQEVVGTSIMGLMMLAAAPGCCILIEASGKDANAALDALEALVSDGFGERD